MTLLKVNWFWRKSFYSYYTYCCSSTHNWNNDCVIMKMIYHALKFLPRLPKTNSSICPFSPVLVILLCHHQLHSNVPFSNFYYYCFFSFCLPYFCPFLHFLAFVIRGPSFSSPSIAREYFFLLLSQNDQSHRVFCNLCCLLILLFWNWWLFYTSVFLHFTCSRHLKVPVVKGRASAKSKYYSVIILHTHVHCFHLIFKVQYRSFY